MYEIINDRLQVGGAPVRFVPTEHVGGRIEPVGIILHDTAGGPPGDSVSWLQHNPGQASAHCIVLRDGTIVQLADFDRKTNHAGKSTWRGAANCNGRFIGIEIVNPGQLYGTADKATATFGKSYTAADGVRAAAATQWHSAGLWLDYSEAQYATLDQLIAALGRAYPTIQEVIGHHHVSPGRKVDPTPLMDWARMRRALGERRPAVVAMTIDVKAAQSKLLEPQLGYYLVGAADGHMGPRTRAAVFAFQEANKLPATGQLDAHTYAVLMSPAAKPMATGARDEITAQSLATNSPTVATANMGERVAQVNVALQAGNALTDVANALAEADQAVRTVEQGRDLTTRASDLAAWLVTPRGAGIAMSLLVSIGVWLLFRRIRARRVAAAQAGKHN